MAGEDQPLYPQTYIAMGNGDLIDVTDLNVDFGNGAKNVHTLRRQCAGQTLGNREATVTFNSAISEDGPERNYWKDCQRGIVRQIRVKVPGGETVLVCTGRFSKVTLDGPLDAETKVSCTFIGRLEEPTT